VIKFLSVKQQRRLVRTWLASHDKTQRWLARRVGISESQLSLILSGQRTLTPEVKKGVYAITRLRLRTAA
jgi:transcriptional regulator with XRE-family HTH domain